MKRLRVLVARQQMGSVEVAMPTSGSSRKKLGQPSQLGGCNLAKGHVYLRHAGLQRFFRKTEKVECLSGGKRWNFSGSEGQLSSA